MHFLCRSVVEHFNCKWPLYPTADCALENYLCQGETEDMARRVAYHQRIQKLPGKFILGSGVSVVCIVSQILHV